MFRTTLLIIGIFFLTSFSLTAQNLNNNKGKKTGEIDASGYIKDLNGHGIGQFGNGGKIYDANGDLIGKIVGNDFEDMNGDFIGSINNSGEILDINNMKIGEITDNFIVKDLSGYEIGRANSAIEKKRLAAYYFFFFNDII